MATTKVATKLQTPENSEGERTDMYPITSSDEVLMAGDENTNLTEKLNNMIVVQAAQPDHACLWLRPMSD